MGYAVSFSQVCLGFTLLVDSKLIGTPILRGYLSTWGGHVDGGYGGHNRGPHAPKDITGGDQGTDPEVSEYKAVLLVGVLQLAHVYVFGPISSVALYQILSVLSIVATLNGDRFASFLAHFLLVRTKVESLVFGADVQEVEVLQRHMMAQMLMERSILEEETDRDSEAKAHVYQL